MPMTNRQLQAFLTEATMKTASEVDQIMRRLRAGGRLPNVRGPHAPALDARGAAHALIATVGGFSPGDALTAVGAMSFARREGEGETVIEELEAALTGEKQIARVSIWLDSMFAEIDHGDGVPVLYRRSKDATPEETFSRAARVVAVVPGGLISALAEGLQ